MFKKTKPQLTPPKPPTLAQILEDMETFVVEKPPIERIRSLPSSNSTHEQATELNIDLEDWWKVFQTFHSDNEDLQFIRRKLVASQKQLDERKKEIKDKTDAIQREIDVALQDSPIES